MMTESSLTKRETHGPTRTYQGGGFDAVYGIGLVGAWVYYFKRATTTRERVWAFFKGLVWPAFVVYNLLRFLSKWESA